MRKLKSLYKMTKVFENLFEFTVDSQQRMLNFCGSEKYLLKLKKSYDP